MAKISCIILTCDSHIDKGGSVIHCLASIFNQGFENFEIIIVENSYDKEGTSDDLEGFCKEQNKKRKEPVNVRVIYNKKPLSQGVARNKGARLASSDLLLFIDDDMIILDSNAFDFIWKKSKKYDYGYGARRVWTKNNLFQRKSREILSRILNNNYQSLISISGNPTSNVRGDSDVSLQKVSFIANFGFCRKSIFWNIGGFPDYKGYGFEDDYLMFRLFEKSYKHTLIDKLNVVHVNHRVREKDTRNIISYFQDLVNDGYYWFHVAKMFREKRPKRENVLEKLTPLHFDPNIEDAYKEYKKMTPPNIKHNNKRKLKHWRESSQFSKIRFSQLISLLQESYNLNNFIEYSGSDFDNLAPLIKVAHKFSFAEIKSKTGKVEKTYNFKFTTPIKSKKICRKKINPKQKYNQFPCDVKSKKRRSSLFKERYPFAEYLKVGIIGDDDLLSLEFKNDYWLWPVVIEKDKSIIDIIKNEDSRIEVYERDARKIKTLPEIEAQTFITDPPYNLHGALIFICAGLKILAKEGGEKEFYVIMNRTMMGKPLFHMQDILSSAGVYLFSVVENFSQYNLPLNYKEKERAGKFAQKIGVCSDVIFRSSSSDLYIFKTRNFDIEKIQKFINQDSIYGHC